MSSNGIYLFFVLIEMQELSRRKQPCFKRLNCNSFLMNLQDFEWKQQQGSGSGFFAKKGLKNRTVCTPFLQHCSSRVLRGKGVLVDEK